MEAVTLAGQPTTVIGHDGELLGGIAGSLMVVREPNLVIALLSNISYADTMTLATKVAEAFISNARSSTAQAR